MPQDGVTLITPTGDRPLAFALCEKYVERQTFNGPLQWIVVDDGMRPTVCTMGQHYLRRRGPRNRAWSLQQNILLALPHVFFQKILFLEDDDWYAPSYVEHMAAGLDTWELLGEGRPIWYNVPYRRWLRCTHDTCASLGQTGLRQSLLAHLQRCCHVQNPFIDIPLWSYEDGRKHLFFDKHLCVGLKGLPGRRGYSVGHRTDELVPKGFQADPDGRVLRQYIGSDAEVYLRLGTDRRLVSSPLI